MIFITTLAWIIGVLSTAYTITLLVGIVNYSKIDALYDETRGIIRVFPITKPIVVAILCWAWIGSY